MIDIYFKIIESSSCKRLNELQSFVIQYQGIVFRISCRSFG